MTSRYVVLHKSGVMQYYERAWDPQLQMAPLGTLVVALCRALEWGDEVSGCSCWPANTTPGQRLRLMFEKRR
jgi:hypothetical protein